MTKLKASFSMRAKGIVFVKCQSAEGGNGSKSSASTLNGSTLRLIRAWFANATGRRRPRYRGLSHGAAWLGFGLRAGWTKISPGDFGTASSTADPRLYCKESGLLWRTTGG